MSRDQRPVPPLVLDASVVINLLATERAWEILACQGVRGAVTPQVIGEIRRCPVTQRSFDPERHPLRIFPNVESLVLSAAEIELFVDLAAEVGDGEAASIAVASMRKLSLALDDRRARSLAAKRFPSLPLVWTTQLLRAPQVHVAFPDGESALLFKMARERARMFVPTELP